MDAVSTLPLFPLLILKDLFFCTVAHHLPAGTYESLLEGSLEPHELVRGSWEWVASLCRLASSF